MAKKNDIVKADSASLQPLENIENLIHVIRGKQVMLDRDLARLYGVETGRLNEQVKRNIERFPEDFMFQLNKDEFENWKSHFAISNSDSSRSQFAMLDDEEKWKSQIAISNSIKMGARKLPYAFTENGVAMLSGVLRSQQAISINIQIMRAFNTMRHFLASNAQVFQRLEVIEHTQLSLVTHQEDTDKKLEEVFRRLDEGEATPKEAIFYNGQFFEARVLLEQIIKTAKTRVIVIDAYVDAATFEMLDVRAKGVKADIYSGKDLRNIQNLHNTSSGLEPIEAHVWKAPSHDRWLIIDDTVYHCGHSLKDMGQKLSAIAQLGVDAEDILKKIR
jgi:hypothetical protein